MHSGYMSGGRYINIYQFKRKLSSRLLTWAVLSIAAGVVLLLGFSSPFWNGVGIQCLAWGGVDAGLAFAARLSGRRSKVRKGREAEKKESNKLFRILWINTVLDFLYIGAGIVLVITIGKRVPAAAGHGTGVIIQGAFLLLFDFFHAKAVPPVLPDLPLDMFQDEKHQPLFLEGRKDKAAVLVHGFPGTPAEMRPLAEALHAAGWTVKSILLPGFGPELNRLFHFGLDDWKNHLQNILRETVGRYDTVLLAGYSFGAALSVQAAAKEPPAGLVLIAPFIRFGTPFQQGIGTVLRPFLPRYFHPFKLLDVNSPGVKHSLASFFPDMNLEDPENIAKIEELALPLPLLADLLRCGKQALKAAASVTSSVLVAQGSNDDVAKPDYTMDLVQSFPRGRSGVDYREIDTGHNVIQPEDPGWESLKKEVLRYASMLEKQKNR
jgi:carboxylesterase